MRHSHPAAAWCTFNGFWFPAYAAWTVLTFQLI
jgi:hypothetical protein